ncbi:hypothetical protein Ancab_036336 [Ancistrocladus abbreviatus]
MARLVEPHDPSAIADALLKLVSDKNLWTECRKNGLKNIHRFSWPEHCRNYLSYVEYWQSRHPTSRLKIMAAHEEPMSESIRELEDLSLKFSVDGDSKSNGEFDTGRQQKELIEALTQAVHTKSSPCVSYGPGRRHGLCIIATDCYNSEGCCSETLALTIKNAMLASGFSTGKMGFVLMTGMSLAETTKALRSSDVNLEDFDALVCNSGGEMFYPWMYLAADLEYEAHIEYRWPGENIRPVMLRVARMEDGVTDDLEEDIEACSSRCYSYVIKPEVKMRKVDNLRQRLRMKGLRCNLVYTHAATRVECYTIICIKNPITEVSFSKVGG